MSNDPYMLELMTVEGFIKRYQEFCVSYPTYQQAYEAVERQYRAAFGKSKYSDYDTFRVILSRFNRK